MSYAIVGFKQGDDVESKLASNLTDSEADVMLLCNDTGFDTINKIAIALLDKSCRKSWQLFLHNCELESVPDSVWELTQVSALLFCRNKLRTISPHIGKLNDTLTSLYLNGNPFRVFPEVVCQLDRLTELAVNGCLLQSLPPSFARLRSLKKLIAGDNNFHEFPEVICELKNLKVLEMENTNIAEMPSSMVQLQHLTHLCIEKNRFREFPVVVCELLNLIRLTFSYNRVAEWPLSITKLVKLTECFAGHNDFTHIPLFLGDLPRLDFLLVDGKYIQRVCVCVCAE